MISDGEEALDYLRRKGKYGDAARPDLIVVDLNMPKVNGQRLSQIFKQDRSGPANDPDRGSQHFGL